TKKASGVAPRSGATVLPCIKLDDQRLVDILRDVAAIGNLLELALELVLVHVDPRREPGLFGERQRFLDAPLLLRLLANRDDAAGLDEHRRDARRAAVERDRAVRTQLARFCARRPEAHAIDDVVEARLEQSDQVLARVALPPGCFGEVAAELAF